VQGTQGTATEGTIAILEIEGLQEELSTQSYAVSDDVLQVGDAMNAVVPVTRTQRSKIREIRERLERGPFYSFYLQNPGINGGKRTLRQRGVLRGISGSSAPGSAQALSLKGQDLGWHLINQSAPTFYRLEHATLDALIRKLVTDNPSWGFQGVRTSNDTNRRLKHGRVSAQIALDPHVFTPYKVIQINPGQRPIDVLQQFVQREGMLLNVSGDGYLQLFNPNYNQQPLFGLFHYPDDDSNRVANNVWGVEFDSSIEGIYTSVTCIWDDVYTGVLNAPFTANLGRHAATYTRSPAPGIASSVEGQLIGPPSDVSPAYLPYPHELVFADSEPLSRQQGRNRATWRAHRDEWNSWVWRAATAGHAQEDGYWSADTLCALVDQIWGIHGLFYVSNVVLEGRVGGANQTRVELRKPGLLSNDLLRLTSTPRRRKDGAQEKVVSP